jgi:multisubunit Na+/H+ antiporter MnhE subunit
MRFSLHNHFGQGTTAAGVFALWLLLAGEAQLGTIVEGVAVAVAASLWVRLIED